jgi:predicted TIM-barrel fold metal-dependent hydrolase
MRIIDADGHVNDRPCMDEISKYMPAGNRTQVFPSFDHIHFHFLEGGEKRSRTGTVGPREWIDFLDETEIAWTAVYPTAGLAVGRIIAEDWAIAACRAYNNWLYEKFTNVSPRIKGVALIPIQDADAAVEELRRAVKQLGMAAAMLPSNGEGIKGHFGSKIYWPIYEEAERLNVPLAVHVGALHHLGMDTIGVYYPVHALGHPFGIMAQAAAMLSYGIFDRFPNLRVGFLEGGATWVPFFMDRLDRSYPHHLQVDIDGEFLTSSQPDVMASEYFRRHVKAGRIFVGFDGDDHGLGYAVREAGNESFVFATDFPHESFDAKSCRIEIQHIRSREDLTAADKEAVLGKNAQKFYGIEC